MKTKILSFIFIIAVTAAFTFIALKSALGGSESKTQSTAIRISPEVQTAPKTAQSAELLMISKEINKELPISTNGVIFYGTSVEGNSLTYHYKMPGFASDYSAKQIFTSADVLVETICTGKDTRPFVSSGVTLVYNYRDQVMAEIYTIAINEKECKERGFK